MSNQVRERILSNLRSAVQQGDFDIPETGAAPTVERTQAEKVANMQRLMTAVHGQVHVVKAGDWVERLKEILRPRELNNLLYAPGTSIGDALEKSWEDDLPPLAVYEGDIENFKEKLFEIDASITSTKGGIAESGAVILWPDEKEPRLMSLVPSIHIAVLEADTIHNSFAEVMEKEGWQNGMPTNALLISGPSKTADIEMTLTFGVHGPKEFIVLILED